MGFGLVRSIRVRSVARAMPPSLGSVAGGGSRVAFIGGAYMIINHRKLVLASTALFSVGFSAHAWAQTAPPAGAEPTEIEAVVVVGSQIKGAKVNAALPVTVV